MKKNSSIDPSVFASLGNLMIQARRLVEGVFVGLHKSPHHGSSIEFAEHKEYTPGDEIRHIDWKAFGKFDKYYVKQFEDETNLRCYLLMDTSGSMGYASPEAFSGLSKFEYATMVALSISYILLRQQDSVGLILFGQDVQSYIPPRAQSSHLQHITQTLYGVEPAGETNMSSALSLLSEIAPKRSTAFILSDFFDTTEDLSVYFRQLKGKKLDVNVMHVLDPYELTFPFDNLTFFKSMERKRKILAEPSLMKNAYIKELQRFINNLKHKCLESDVEYTLMDTGEDLTRMMITYFTARNRKGPQGLAARYTR
jgi:uncharacterized protein (DUF58 family)